MADQQRRSTESTPESWAPIKRTSELVTSGLGDELMVYDTLRHHIHHLNRTAVVAWRLCDGRRSVEEIAVQMAVELDGAVNLSTARLALEQLAQANLLDGASFRHESCARRPGRLLSRRATLKGALAIPMIVSTTAPAVADTLSNQGTCSSDWKPCPGGDADCCATSKCVSFAPGGKYYDPAICFPLA